MTVTLADLRKNPLLMDEPRLSPAESLDLPTGEVDEDGWPESQTLRIGQLVKSERGLWRVLAFTLDDLVICQPYGPGHAWGIATVNYMPEGLRGVAEPQSEV